MIEVGRSAMSERDLDRAVADIARRTHWLRYHTYRSQRSPSGFPDLCLVRPPRVLFIELKSEKGKPTTDQARWLQLLERCPGIEVYLWRPADFERIAKVLSPRWRDGPPS